MVCCLLLALFFYLFCAWIDTIFIICSLLVLISLFASHSPAEMHIAFAIGIGIFREVTWHYLFYCVILKKKGANASRFILHKVAASKFLGPIKCQSWPKWLQNHAWKWYGVMLSELGWTLTPWLKETMHWIRSFYSVLLTWQYTLCSCRVNIQISFKRAHNH